GPVVLGVLHLLRVREVALPELAGLAMAVRAHPGLQFRPRLRESVIRALVHTAHHLHFGQLAVDHASFRRHRLRYREADLEVEGVARSTMMVAEHRAGDPDALTRDGLDQFRDRGIHVLRHLAAGYNERYDRRCDLFRSD